MNAAGYPNGFTSKFLYRTGTGKDYEDMVLYLAQTGKKAGIWDLTVDPRDNATMRKMQDEVSYEGLVAGIDGEPLPENFLIDYRTGGPKNGMGLSDPDLDKRIDQAISIPDTNTRKEAVLNLARYILENAMWKRNYTDGRSTAFWRAEVKNYFGPNPQQYNNNEFAFAWLDKA